MESGPDRARVGMQIIWGGLVCWEALCWACVSLNLGPLSKCEVTDTLRFPWRSIWVLTSMNQSELSRHLTGTGSTSVPGHKEKVYQAGGGT